MKTTEYFTNSVMICRPYLKTEWIEFVLNDFSVKEYQQGYSPLFIQ